MKNFSPRSIAFLILTLALSFGAAHAQKMTAEEVIAKHLDSIGSKEKRAAVKNQFALSDVELIIKGTPNKTLGKAIFVSEGDKNLWGMNLNSNDYPLDRFGFDGKDTKVGFMRPGVRSFLGSFIISYKELLKEGLLGGTLLSSWALLDTDARKPKLSYDGTKKVDDRETHVLSYSPKGGSDLTIKMYFDAKNFRHVRTEYTRVIAARQGPSLDTSARQTADYYRMIENFSDFQSVNGLNMPKTYKLSLSYTGSNNQNTTRELEWIFSVTNLSLNQQLEPNSFDIDAK